MVRRVLPLLLATLSLFVPLSEAQTERTEQSSAFDLKVQLAENALLASGDFDAFSRLVAAYEDALLYYCFSSVTRTLNQQVPPQEPRCVELIEKTLSAHPGNPAAICARDGILSPDCNKAVDGQAVAALRPSPVTLQQGGGPTLDLERHLDAIRRSPAVEQKMSELFEQERRYKIEPSNKRRRILIETLEEVVRLTCTRAQVELRQVAAGTDSPSSWLPEVAAPTPTPYVNDVSIFDRDRPLGTTPNILLGEELNPLPPTPTASPTPAPPSRTDLERLFAMPQTFTRVRLVPEQCLNASNRLLNLDGASVPAHCALHGIYSPQCFTGLRAQRAERVKSGNRPQQKSNRHPAFQSF